MPPRDAADLLDDIVGELHYLADLAYSGRLDAYPLDPTLKRSVERAIEIAGEAVRQLRHSYPSIALSITDAQRIVAVRTILAHRYFKVDPDVIRDIVLARLPPMLREIETMKMSEIL